jgi:tRNA1(Val) A37 N6-methylase TrmN6
LTRDVVLDGKVVLWQPDRGYRAGVDPVLLAASVEASSGARVLDLGCGVGAVALCLLARRPDVSVTGLEINPDLVTLARRNAVENRVETRLQIVSGSVDALPGDIAPGSFDLVVTNPPYMAAGTTAPSPEPGKRTAHVEAEADLETWVAAAARSLKPRGFLTLIHRADRLDHLLAVLRDRFGGIVVHPLWPRTGVSAKRVILRARKDSAAPARLEAGTVLHAADGHYTTATAAALAGAAFGSQNTL